MDWQQLAPLLEYSPYLAAFIVGLLGGVHCIGMCGGIVSALTFSLPSAQRQNTTQLLPLLLAYNTGRIGGYVLAGAIAGGIGSVLLSFTDLETGRAGLNAVRYVLQIIAALFMIALGLYLAGVWSVIAKVESAGRALWKHIEPFGRRFMPVNSAAKALPLGFIWGWLPCGLVYSVLIWALSAGNALNGALLMLAFGLGTLPNLMIMGALAVKLTNLTRNPTLKRTAGFLVVLLGLGLLGYALVNI